MGLTARQAAGLFAGTLGFGVLSFASGLMIGVGIAPSVLDMRQQPVAPAAPASPASPAKPPAPAAGPNAGPAIAAASPGTGPAAVQPGPGAQPATAVQPGPTAPAGAPAQTADASAAPPAPTPPIPVKDFRVGLPLEEVAATTAVTVPEAMMTGSPAAGPATAGGAKMPAMGAATASPAAPTATPSPFMLSVQVGSFLLKQNADRLAAELNSKAYAAQVVVAQNPGGKAWYHVVLAPVRDVNAVTQLAQEFSATEGRSAQVVSWLDGK